MSAERIDLDIADLAAAIEELSQADIDGLPFGVIAVDRLGKVLLYSRTEREQSGYCGPGPVGQNLFRIGCFAGSFRSRIEEALQAGKVDLEIGWFGDYADPGRSLRIRVQSGQSGKLWFFIERDAEAETEASRGADGARADTGCCSKAER